MGKGAIGLETSSVLIVVRTHFAGCRALYAAGAISLFHSTAQVSECFFSKCVAPVNFTGIREDGCGGGAFRVSGSDLFMSRTLVQRCRSIVGGAITLEFDAQISTSTLTDCSFVDCVAGDVVSAEGGAVRVDGGSSLVATSCSFSGCRAHGEYASGGAVFLRFGSLITMKACVVTHCSAVGTRYASGGGVTNEGGSVGYDDQRIAGGSTDISGSAFISCTSTCCCLARTHPLAFTH